MATLLERLKRKLKPADESDVIDIEDALSAAIALYLSTLYRGASYPVGDDGEPILNRIAEDWIYRAAVIFYSKTGTEGQTGHSENGINRTYETADIPMSMINEIVPIVGVAHANP